MASKTSCSKSTPPGSKPAKRPIKRQRSPYSDDSDSDSTRRKQHRRVSKACERCRLKKTKCDGEMPCQRCTYDGVACCEGSRKKSGSKTVAESCVELLEYQQTKLIAGHIKMYKMMVDAGIWTFGNVRKNSRGVPVVHEILEKLGVMRTSSELASNFPESPAENRALREQLEIADQRKNKLEQANSNPEKSLEESPPSLIHTDRESSIDSSNSFLGEARPKIDSLSNPATPTSSTTKSARLQQHYQSEKDISWSSDQWTTENIRSNPFIPSSIPGFFGNPSLIDPPILPSTTHLMPEFSTKLDGLESYHTSVNSNRLFPVIPGLGSADFIHHVEMGMNITPTAMKYAYDPYMG
ncbi:hypothetical protein K3495_g10223 [Podosphaera aphanis]|nr:hypothetical protein K3495_g10223 [Podosphaera aphanis]